MADEVENADSSSRQPVIGTKGQRISIASGLAGTQYEYFVPTPLASLSIADDFTVRSYSEPRANASPLACWPILAAIDSAFVPTQSGDLELLRKRIRQAEQVSLTVERFASCSKSYPAFDEIHKHYFRFSPGIGGTRRDALTWVSGQTPASAELVPPPTSSIPALLQDYVEFYARQDIALWTKIALLHYQLLTIHPFRDGNGRLSRLLVATFGRSSSAGAAIANVMAAMLCAKKDQLSDRFAEVRRGQTDRYFEDWRRLLETADEFSCASAQAFDGVRRELCEKLDGAKHETKMVSFLLRSPIFNLDQFRTVAVGSLRAAERCIDSMLSKNAIVSIASKFDRRGCEFTCPMGLQYWLRIEKWLTDLTPSI